MQRVYIYYCSHCDNEFILHNYQYGDNSGTCTPWYIETWVDARQNWEIMQSHHVPPFHTICTFKITCQQNMLKIKAEPIVVFELETWIKLILSVKDWKDSTSIIMGKEICSCFPCSVSSWMKPFGTFVAAIAFFSLLKRILGLGLYGYDIISKSTLGYKSYWYFYCM